MRRHGLLIAGALVFAAFVAAGASAHSTPGIRAAQAHARAVRAEVSRIGVSLEATIQKYDGAQVELQQVKASLAANTLKLRLARANFHEAQRRIMARIYSLYVGGKPTTLDVLAGAHSLSQVIDRAEAAQAISQQDTALGQEALRFEHAVQKRQHNLTLLRAKRADAVRTLDSQKQQIESALAQQKHLLASIHSSIHQLQVQEAAHEAALRAAAEARLRAIAAAKAAAAAAATTQLQSSGSFPHIPPILGNGSGHPAAAQIALQYLGVPYVWGGASPSGFDCSGLVMYVYAQLGISLPHLTYSQRDVTYPISTSQMQPGDLVFFDGFGHVGIYIGGGQFVDAPHTGSVVRIDSLSGWGGSFDGARRVP
jgi:cell wall-associated NlpC family hydrolase